MWMSWCARLSRILLPGSRCGNGFVSQLSMEIAGDEMRASLDGKDTLFDDVNVWAAANAK